MGDVDDRDLLAIGRFARLTGLSIGALRHYDELDLLRPAAVDPATGYRSYRADQVGRGREIARLRSLEMPLDEIRRVIDTDDPADRRRLLALQRARVEARTNRLVRIHHALGHLVKEPSMPETVPTELDAATERALAKSLFNHTWELLEQVDRTAEQDDEMIHAAHASRYHWGRVGEPANRARGEWQCARVYSTLRRPEPALWHARRCLAILEEHGPGDDWDLAGAYEGLARAHAVAGDAQASAEWRQRAVNACTEIANPEDRRLIELDIAALP